ncbi:MAG: hypothetical protein AAGL24_16610 [Pseudomonadota bacterium]
MLRDTLLGLMAVMSLAMPIMPLAAHAAHTGGPKNAARIAELKQEIFALAETFKGQGDPDFSRQRAFEPLITELLRLNPQPPIADRLPVLAGAWRQVWGPYDYRSNGARGVDPATDPDRIYQVVFPEGFYVNVAPSDVRDRGATRDIVLLKGEYQVATVDPDMLQVRFVRFTKTEQAKAKQGLWQLAAQSADQTLDNQSTILPGFLVRLFFGGGGLREVYTDDTMRITYGARDLTDRSDEFIYIMRRMD